MLLQLVLCLQCSRVSSVSASQSLVRFEQIQTFALPNHTSLLEFSACFPARFLPFCSFEFVSDFEFRASNLFLVEILANLLQEFSRVEWLSHISIAAGGKGLYVV